MLQVVSIWPPMSSIMALLLVSSPLIMALNRLHQGSWPEFVVGMACVLRRYPPDLHILLLVSNPFVMSFDQRNKGRWLQVFVGMDAWYTAMACLDAGLDAYPSTCSCTCVPWLSTVSRTRSTAGQTSYLSVAVPPD
jgi:hypothetical protein